MLLFQQSYFLKIKHFFRAATFSEDLIFGSGYFFRKAIISSIFFLRKFRFQSFFNFWCHFKKEKWNIGITQQTINVDSTLINVEITSRLRSTWYPRWFKVDFSTLIHRQNSTLKQRRFCVDSKNNFVLISWYLKKLKSLY